MPDRATRGERPSWIGVREWAGKREFMDTAQDDIELLIHAGWSRERPFLDGGSPSPEVVRDYWEPRLRPTVDRSGRFEDDAGEWRPFPADRRVLGPDNLVAWGKQLAEQVN